MGIESVAVLGGGTMGAGIAGYLARAGLRVALADASPELAEQARERLLERTQGHVDAGLLPAEVTERTGSVAAARDVEAAAGGVDLVVEAVPEDPALKADAGPYAFMLAVSRNNTLDLYSGKDLDVAGYTKVVDAIAADVRTAVTQKP